MGPKKNDAMTKDVRKRRFGRESSGCPPFRERMGGWLLLVVALTIPILGVVATYFWTSGYYDEAH